MLTMNPFIRDDVMPSWWANAIQKRLSVGAYGFALSKASPTSIQVIAAADDQAAVIPVAGKWRWNEATVNRAHPGGGAGTFDVFVTAKGNSIVNVPAPGTDTTDYSFALAIVAHNATPPIVAGTVDIFRKVAELDWDGALITSLRQIVGAVPRPSNGAGDGVEALRALGTGAGQAMAGITRLDAIPAPANAVDLNGQKLTDLGAPTDPSDAVRNDDARLANARAPTAHAATHRAGGSDPLSVAPIAGASVLDVGQVGQVRAGHTLAATDFTALLGLGAPAALWNLSDASDVSGSGRNLTNKGSVPFGVGILGAAATAAVFVSSAAQALFVPDAGGGDALRLKTGSFGGWFRSAKYGIAQPLIAKVAAAGNLGGYEMYVNSSGMPAVALAFTSAGISGTLGTDYQFLNGTTYVADDRWHHIVATYDGTTCRLYVDGTLDASANFATAAAIGPIFGGAAPFNIGSLGADGATSPSAALLGRADEVFVTPDVLVEEQVRLLCALKVAHGYPVTPSRALMTVARARRGAPLSAVAGADFPAVPSRLYNFTAAALTDAGSNNVPVVAVPGGGSIADAPGVDGTRQGAQEFVGPHSGFTATDGGLPSGTSARSYGAWFKTAVVGGAIIAWGNPGANQHVVLQVGNQGLLQSTNGGDSFVSVFVADGRWHHAVVVEDNAAADGIRRKLYLDGRVVFGSTTLNSITLGGAGWFRLGANGGGTNPLFGSIDGAFVYAGALTSEQVWALYQKPTQALPGAPKDSADHVEAIDATNMYAIFDTLEPQDQVTLWAAA